MWLARAAGTDDGLVFPGRPTRSTADLCLGPDHVELRAHGAVAVLPWEATELTWTVEPLTSSHWPTTSSRVWTAVFTKGEATNRVAPVLLALAAATHRYLSRDPTAHAFVKGPVVPLHRPPAGSDNRVWSERATLWALCRVLATRPELRPRLLDHDRMDELRRQLATGAVGLLAEGVGLRRTTNEILTAMRGAHLTHPLGGRPVPGDRLLSRPEAVDLVRSRMRANRFAQGVEVTEAQISAQLDANYYAVAPWPFGALTKE